ncbi:MAG: wapA 1, partial [Mucilaginibacter sp.]|nr:wapA 1 [Mucilaginibacter sp.]
PTGLAMTPGGVIYVAELANHDIRRIMPDGTVKQIAGSPAQASGNTDATGTAATFNNPLSIYIDNTGTGYVVDMWADVRKIVLTGYSISGTLPAGLTFDATTGTISGTPTASVSPQIYTITAYNASGHSSATVTLGAPPTVSYNGSQTYTYNVGSGISPLIPTVTNNPVPYTGYTTTFAGSGALSSVDGIGTAASFSSPVATAMDSKGNIYIGDVKNTNVIRKISPSAVVTALAGSGSAGFINGTGAGASFSNPIGLATDTSGNVYVADEFNNAIRKVTPSGVVTTLAGGTPGTADGTGTAAQFNHPTGVVVDASGNVYVTDFYNHTIRKVTPAGVVTTFAGGIQGSADGTGTAAQFNYPVFITMDAAGNFFVGDRSNSKIRKITPAGVVTTIAGNGTAGFADGAAASAMFNLPTGLAIDGLGNLYVADVSNHRIRRISPAGMVTTLAGSSTSGTANGVGSAVTFGGTFGGPAAISIDASGSLYASDYQNNLIRKVVTTAYTISPALPAGLSFDPATGIISGTPTAAITATTYTITAYNMIGIGSTTLGLTITMPVPLAPSSNQNYIITYTPRISGIATSTAVVAASGDQTKIQTNIQYFDGLGRPLQTVQVKGSPSGKDVVQPIAYDQFGREATKYLPYAASTNDGSYKTAAFADQGSFYTTPPTGVSAIPYPSAQTGFEPSPLNRVIEQGASGAAWQPYSGSITNSGHTVKMVYTTNNTTALTDTANTYFAALYSISGINSTDQSRTLARGSGTLTDYTAAQLYVTVTKNENWVSGKGGTTEEYKDKEGHIVLKRTFNYVPGATPVLQILSTYYVYDDLGNLAYVLPPLSNADSALPSQAMLDNLCYQYRYDERNRLTQKKLPGKGWEYIVYNQLDQPVLTQDTIQRATNQWTVTKYDGQGRMIMTGLWNAGSAIPASTLQASIYAGTQWDDRDYTNNTTGYNIGSYPAVTTTLTTNYYDDYNNIPLEPSAYATAPTSASTMTKGLLTATKTAVLNTPADMLWTVHYYDDLGRNVQSYKQHYFGGMASPYNYDVIASTYDFTNAVTTTTRQHYTKNAGNTAAALGVTISNRYIYDHMGRKLKTWQQLQNGTQTADTRTLISKIDYNEVGQVLTKHLHSTDSLNFLQNIAYGYNERGWLLNSNSALFQEQLQYNSVNNVSGISPAAQYNGNIASQTWINTAAPTGKSYTYTYDQLNRLTSGIATDNNNENGITYDLEGNITKLNRYSAGLPTDQLSYTYINTAGDYTNQLQTIKDNSTNSAGINTGGPYTYVYDPNGNVTTDPSRSTGTINIVYNLLNLPQNITGAKTITYTYDAAGNKLRRVSPNTGNTDYIDGIQYENGAIKFIRTEEGRALANGTTAYNYEYSLTDHLGNSRIGFDTYNQTSAHPVQTDDYYPFGMEISVGTIPSLKNNYLYNKKELQEELGQYDYGARFYDPVIARWNVVDAYAEHPDQIDLSPYAYVGNNPITRTDPDGNCQPCDVPDDENDFLRYSNEADRNQSPTKAIIHDASVGLLDFLGVRGLVRTIEHLGDKNVSIGEKAAKTVQAVVNLAPIDGEGEREPTTGKGAANAKVLDAINNGNAAHADFKAKADAKGWKTEVKMIDPKTGKTVRADAVTPSGKPVELKPNTPSGQKKGASQLPKYERATGNKGRVVYYKPKKAQ